MYNIFNPIEAFSDVLLSFRCDLTDEDEILAVFAKIRDDFGRIDICINNAGINSNTSLIHGHTEDWRNIVDVGIIIRILS